MIVVYVIMMLLFLAAAGRVATIELTSRKTYSVGYKAQAEYSDASLEILKAYNALPKANRPVGDMTYMLKALDTKHTIKDVDGHFSTTEYNRSRGKHITEFTWNCNCSRYSYRETKCPFKEYVQIKDGINDIGLALEAQQHAMKIAGVESGLSDAADMAERLREEAEIITKVTKELTQ
jgi:hypothetical protein